MVSLAGHVVENRVPRHAVDRAVERPAGCDDRGRQATSSQLGDGSDEARRSRCSPGKPPTGAVRGGRARAARPAVRGDRAAPPREGAGHPPPGEGADRTRRADRRRARGGVRRGRDGASGRCTRSSSARSSRSATSRRRSGSRPRASSRSRPSRKRRPSRRLPWGPGVRAPRRSWRRPRRARGCHRPRGRRATGIGIAAAAGIARACRPT